LQYYSAGLSLRNGGAPQVDSMIALANALTGKHAIGGCGALRHELIRDLEFMNWPLAMVCGLSLGCSTDKP